MPPRYDLAEEDHLLMFNRLFGQVRDGGDDEQFDEASFLARTGLAKEELIQLSLMGLISQPNKAENHSFDGFDLTIARALKALITMGIGMEDLKLYRDFLQCARIEAELVHDRVVHQYAEAEHQPLMEIQIRLERVKNLLSAKAYREFFINHRHKEITEKGGD